MLYIINDTEVSIRVEHAIASSPGGSSAFVAGYLNYLQDKDFPAVPLGNYKADSSGRRPCISLAAPSNARFIVNLLRHFLLHPPHKQDLLYFHRPDHVALSVFSRSKKIVHLHGQPRAIILAGRKRLTRYIFLSLEKISMAIVDLVIATDPLTAEYYQSCYPRLKNRIEILPTGIDRNFFSPAREDKLGAAPKSRKLVFIGRLAYPKLVNRILEAFRLHADAYPESQLVITGEGPQMQHLEMLSRQLGLSKQVSFTGKLSKESVRNLIHSSSAAILLSEREGSPISVKEVLACGKPVIVNPVGDLTDYVIQGKNGYIVDAENTQQVAEAIRQVFAVGAEMQQSCIESMEEFDESRIYQHLHAIISKQTLK